MKASRSPAEDRLAQRRQTYCELSSRLAGLEPARLQSLLQADSCPAGTDWSRHQLIRVGRTRVFVKRVPLTDAELCEPFTTRNLYDLPLAYHYGVGSAGHGVYRELVTQIRASNWVLGGRHAGFPLLYHHRVQPMPPRAGGPPASLSDWPEQPAIARYLRARVAARHELLLFLEYQPETLRHWLWRHPRQVARVLAELRRSVDFLHSHGILHLDLHFLNVLTDGERCYLSDFGLALDRRFALDAAERDFYARHRDYDYGQLLWSLCYVVREAYERSPHQAEIRARLGLADGLHARRVFPPLLEQLESLQELLGLDGLYLEQVLKYRDVIRLMQRFFTAMQSNPRKNTPFRHRQLRRLLQAVDFLPSETGT